MMSVSSQPPSIPGRTQRILINKKQPFSANNAAKRCFNRGMSSNKVPGQGSLTGVSDLSTNASFSSFANASSKLKKENTFGVKTRRFDAKLELKEYYNKDPGPGTYESFQHIDEVQNVESVSKRGFLNGFASKGNRFHVDADMLSSDPNITTGPG